MDNAQQYKLGILEARRCVKQSGSSFYWAMRLLPLEKRDAMYCIYAFCRQVDDIADSTLPKSEKEEQLSHWRESIERIFNADTPKTPVTIALSETIKKYQLPKDDCLAVIEGMGTDTNEQVLMPDQKALSLYIDQVACAVGRLSNHVFGLDSGKGNALAASLGEALQLTNILRDIEEDSRRERLYIPLDLLAENGVPVGLSIAERIQHPNFPKACALLARQAQEQFAQSQSLMGQCDKELVRSARLMMVVYERLLKAIVLVGWSSFHFRVKLGFFEKLWIVIRYGF